MKSLLNIIDKEFAPGEVENSLLEVMAGSAKLNNPESYKLILSSLDYTSLNVTDTVEYAEKIASKVNHFHEVFPELPNVAAICVYPPLVETIRKNLQAPGVKVASVSGGFPSSMTFLETKEMETRMVINKGADEIDVVLPVGKFLTGHYTEVMNEISVLKNACGNVLLKVILETGALKSFENIWKTSLLAMQAGADFIKTSTGKIETGATPEAAWVMCQAIKAYFEKTGRKVGFKAAGGIAETTDALKYMAIVKAVIGDEWLTNRLFRIGASRLANNLLTSLKGKPVVYF